MALLYPNTYPVAVSNLGFQWVYSLLNQEEGIVCERFVYPEDGRPLRSLESSRPLSDFPLVFGSISFEQDYPRLAAMLAAGGIPPFAAQRADLVAPGEPLVILGGVGVFMNPEPLAAFADLMVIGEAEPLLLPLLQHLSNFADTPRLRLLADIATSLPGCYVPMLYQFSWHPNGAVKAIVAPAGLPARVNKVVAAQMDCAAHSTLMSPEAELSMYMVELGRGCSRGCRFCAAGFIYRPPRIWENAAVAQALAARPRLTERIGLIGMELADSESLDSLASSLLDQGCTLSFSSLRADRISEQLLSLLAASHLKSVAIAADGASERLRSFINKGLSEDDILQAAERLVAAGIFHLKLYVMIGLPSETEEDLAELVHMVKRLLAIILPIGRARGRVSELTLSINCFVPKPWTPFQYASFGGLTALDASEENTAQALLALKGKIRYLRQMLNTESNLRFKWDPPEQALSQAVYARADRRIGPALLDIGTGRLSWKQAMRQHAVHPWQFAIRPRSAEEHMCWEVVDHGIQPSYLWAEWQRAMQGRSTPTCEPMVCRRCGVCHELP